LKTEFSKAKNIGLNYTGLSHKGFQQLSTLFPKAQFTDVSNALVMTRQIKDNYELDQIQKACAITDKIMEKIPELLVEGIAEFEIAAEINYLMHKLGAEKPGFDTISSFNTNTAEPHYTQGSTRLKHGDFALFDIGACVQKYNSDITRTFVFGKATKRQKDMYSTVQAAQDIGFNEIRPGVQASDVHHAVSSFIDKTPYKGRFIHSTGHSLGILVHDGARLTTGSTLRLQENMVFTVEPGVYIPNFGGVRIEDDVMVTKKGVQLLTKVSRDFQEI
jgi:Xaa-Pro dipeptidase